MVSQEKCRRFNRTPPPKCFGHTVGHDQVDRRRHGLILLFPHLTSAIIISSYQLTSALAIPDAPSQAL